MKTFLRQCFTGKDNQTIDIARILWALAVLGFIVFAGIHVMVNHQFDPSSYGVGLGSALAGGGIGIGAKGHTEPGS
jgi:hypothetical protein